MEFKKGKKQILYIWWIYLSLGTLFLSSLVFLFIKILSPVFFILLIIIFLAFIYFFVYYFPVKLGSYSYYVGKNFLIIKSGVYWKKTTLTLINNIQYLTKKTNILDKFFKISSVQIKSAGGGSQYLYGLDENEAVNIVDILFKAMKEK